MTNKDIEIVRYAMTPDKEKVREALLNGNFSAVPNSSAEDGIYLTAVIDAAKAWLTAQDSGMVLVPREPTKSMIKAGEDEPYHQSMTSGECVASIYRAMITASENEFENVFQEHFNDLLD